MLRFHTQSAAISLSWLRSCFNCGGDILNRIDKALELFDAHFNCAQSVFASFSDELGITRDFALKISTGFGGGMGRKQYVCGAVSGGIMVINTLYGRGESEEKEVGAEAYAKVRNYVGAFEAARGTAVCKDLLDGVELLTEEGQERFQRDNMRSLCRGYVETAVELLEPFVSEKLKE